MQHILYRQTYCYCLLRVWHVSLLQYEALATHYKFVTITVYIIMFTVEGARLYLGYEGNLREKVPYTVFA